jgi:hypothetical protein
VQSELRLNSDFMKTGKVAVIPRPEPPDDTDDVLAMEMFKTEYKIYLENVRDNREEITKLFPMIWREMSLESQQRCLESKLDLDNQDVEVLYERIQETHAISKASGVLDIDRYNVRQSYQNLTMSDNEHLSAYVKRTHDCLKLFERM